MAAVRRAQRQRAPQKHARKRSCSSAALYEYISVGHDTKPRYSSQIPYPIFRKICQSTWKMNLDECSDQHCKHCNVLRIGKNASQIGRSNSKELHSRLRRRYQQLNFNLQKPNKKSKQRNQSGNLDATLSNALEHKLEKGFQNSGPIAASVVNTTLHLATPKTKGGSRHD